MNILIKVKPTNLLAEKEKFLADHSYNPQFTYQAETTQAELTQWGEPNQAVYEYALAMVTENSLPPIPKVEERVTVEYIQEKIAAFNEFYACKEPLLVYFEKNLVSRCKVTSKAIYFQLPIVYSAAQLTDLLRHELETHVLRNMNHRLQEWSEYVSPETVIRSTEEGLANLHTHLLRADKRLYKSFFSYLAAYLAQQHSFATVYDTLIRLGRSPETSWNTTVKVKRGLTDTSKPGAFTRGICYLEGAITMWQWVLDERHDLRQLYWGRLAIEELPNFTSTVPQHELKVPTFINESDTYREHVTELGRVNQFETLQRML